MRYESLLITANFLAGLCLLLLLLCLMLWRKQIQLKAQHEIEKGLDSLTGTWNRIRFMELAEQQVNHVQRTGRRAAALIIDLDRCQKINEQYGHAAGDQAVQLLARSAQTTLRNYDLLGRYSGEELAMLLPDTTLEGASAVARRMRDALGSGEITTANGQCFQITITIGISAITKETDTLEDLLVTADAALSEAKSQGHNRTVALPV